MNELVSVIMSTYNEETDMVEKSIESILNQSYINIEFIIILDNPENLRLKKLLYQYESYDQRVKVFVNDKNLGLVKSLNVALKQCSGRYIARMDADDISISERLMTQKEYLENNKLDFVFSSMILIDENGNKLYETNKDELSYTDVKKVLEKGNISTHPTWFLKREVYEELDGYREVLYCEDYDFTLRCLLKGFKIGKVNQSLLMYRIRSNSISRSNSFEQYRNSIGILKLYKENSLDDMNLVFDIVKKSQSKAELKVKERFMIADKKFRKGIENIRNKQIINGLVNIFYSFFISKYYTQKNIKIILYKIRKYTNFSIIK
ncbi:glycosyltransferase [Bacillus kwashiorkori]|uniref:glycosyltransferase n=1 Tax=Bacillus kwashiorkori TaxID=1522318 RepID=UPI00078679B5|nr:glycosyltransferase [Bacillus kwashiorkori]